MCEQAGAGDDNVSYHDIPDEDGGEAAESSDEEALKEDGSNANFEIDQEERGSNSEGGGGGGGGEPHVNSTKKEHRIEARRLRVARKCEEARLEQLDLDPFAPVIADYVSKSHQQICESRLALLKVRFCFDFIF